LVLSDTLAGECDAIARKVPNAFYDLTFCVIGFYACLLICHCHIFPVTYDLRRNECTVLLHCVQGRLSMNLILVNPILLLRNVETHKQYSI
jgi:hypothetical protein